LGVIVTLVSEGGFLSFLPTGLDSLDGSVEAFGVYWALNLDANVFGSLSALSLK
jgi:hypothetical protein